MTDAFLELLVFSTIGNEMKQSLGHQRISR